VYKIYLTNEALKAYEQLRETNETLFSRVRNAIKTIAEKPRQGKPLRLELKGKWSYRVGVYRIIYKIKKGKLVIYIITIGHRREVYS